MDQLPPELDESLKLNWLLRVVVIVALLVSGYLAAVAIQSSGPAGCGESAVIDCDHVLKTRWSSWFNIPVAIPAVLLYSTLLITTFLNRQSLKPLRITLGLTAGMASFWFAGLQFFIIKKLCSYCLVVHACGIVTFLITVANVASAIKTKLEFPAIPIAGTAFLTLALISVQLTVVPDTVEVTEAEVTDDSIELDSLDGSTEPADNQTADHASTGSAETASEQNDDAHNETVKANSAAESSSTEIDPILKTPAGKIMTILQGKARIDTANHPFVGDRDADETFIKLFDYSCPDCRMLHRQLEVYATERNRRIALVLMPVPMNKDCNPYLTKTGSKHLLACEYAKLALAFWIADPEQFPAFHEWMMKDEYPPSVTAAKMHAGKLLNDASISDVSEKMKDPIIAERIIAYTKIYKASGGKIVPKLFVRDRLIAGASPEPKKMFGVLDRLLTQ